MHGSRGCPAPLTPSVQGWEEFPRPVRSVRRLASLALSGTLVALSFGCQPGGETESASTEATRSGPVAAATESPPPPRRPLCSDPETFDRQLDLPSPGEPITLRGSETDAFAIATTAGETLEIAADQDGIDVYLALFEEQGERLVATDRPTARLGEERLIWVGGSDRPLRLHVCAWGSQGISGTYTLRVQRRPAEPGDDATVAAYRQVEEAKRLIRLGPTRWDDALAAFRLAVAQEVHPSGQFLRTEARYRLARLLQDQRRFEDALEILDALHVEHDHRAFPELAVKILNRRAVVLRALVRYEEAVPNYDQALELAKSSGHARLVATVLVNKGDYFESIDEVSKAVSAFDEALEIWRRLEDAPKTAQTLQSRGASYSRLGKPQEALDDLLEALDLQEELGVETARAATLLRIGNALISQQRPQEAEARLYESLALAEQAGDILGRGFALGSLITALNDQRRYSEALAISEKRQQLLPSFGSLVEIGVLEHNIAISYEGLERFDESLTHYGRALENFTKADDVRASSITRLGIAQVHRKRGELQLSLESIVRAIREVESLRSNLESYDLRSSYLATERSQYEFLIDLLMELHEKNPSQGYDARALAISERSRARSQLDALADRNDSRPNVDRSPETEQTTLARQIQELENERLSAIQNGTPQVEIETLERDLRRLLQRYRRSEVLSSGQRPSDAQSLEGPFDITRVQALLDSDTALLEYHIGIARSFLWIVQKDALSSFVLPNRRTLEADARRVYGYLARSYQRRLRFRTLQSLCDLSATLLDPELLDLRARRLLIASEGALDYIPFSALPLPGQCETSDLLHASVTPLDTRFEVVSIPSASLLGAIRTISESQPRPSQELLLVADPLPAVDTEGPQSFERLEHSRDEALAIRAGVGAEHVEALFGEQATYEELAEHRPGDFRVLHFATHGELNTEHPELSRLILTPSVDRDGHPRDFLFAHEIDDLDLVADLVVLSACETALGTEIRGEGLVGLPQAFMVAGAAAVLVSLWKVDDASTRELMTEFYDNLYRESRNPAAALAAAQRTVREKHSDPFFWAGFVLLGDWRQFTERELDAESLSL